MKNDFKLQNMSVEQKLKLLSGQLDGAISFVDFSEITLNSGIINSFDMPAINKHFLHKAKSALNSLVQVDLAVKLNPYSLGISEDAFLNMRYGAVAAAGLSEGGAKPVLGVCGLNDFDLQYLDLEPNYPLIKDTIVKPFTTAAKNNSGALTMVNFTELKGAYQKINTIEIIKSLNGQPFCTNGGGALALKAGALFVRNYPELMDSHQAFLSLKRDFDKGTITINEFDTQLKEGDYLSHELIDAAANRALEFVAGLNAESEQASDLETAQMQSNAALISNELARSSIVLLKNEGLLPIASGARVAVIGAYEDSFCELIATNSRIRLSGREIGYDLGGERNDDLHAQALKLAKGSDLVLLFIERNQSQSSLKLSPNKLKLIDDLAAVNKRVVAIISEPCDMSFDKNCEAVVLLPKSQLNYAAFLDIITGIASPSGKLPYTLYDDTDRMMEEIEHLKDTRNLKIGQFLGYRYYDTAGVAPKYEFGHGLSFTSFSYSKLKIDGNLVSFELKNTGQYGGAEVAQVYIGKKNSVLACPKKKLVGFSKIYLSPNGTQKVNIRFSEDELKVLYGEQFELEDGTYTLSVGSSVSDIRLKRNFNLRGKKLVGQNNLVDYIQSISNIVSGGYSLEGGVAKTTLNSTLPFEQLFLEQFKKPPEPLALDNQEILEIDRSLTAKKLAAQLSENLALSGYSLSTVSIHALISSMLGARLILVQDSRSVCELLRTVGECFGQATVLESGEQLTDIPPLTVTNCIIINRFDRDIVNSLSAYAQKPDIGAIVINDRVVKLPPNLWFFVAATAQNLKGFAPLGAVYIDLKLNKSVAKSTPIGHGINYLSFLQAAENSMATHFLDEPHFKRVDSLVALTRGYLAKCGGDTYNISNKDWHCLEKMSAAYHELSQNPQLSLDFAVASRLVLGLANIYVGANNELCTNLEKALGESASQSVLNARRMC